MDASPFQRRLRQAEPENLEFPVESLRAGEWLTPTELFYVRSHFPPPALDRDTFTLTIDGEVERPLRLSWADLQALPRRALPATLECAGNRRAEFEPPPSGVPWRSGAVSNGEWAGIPLAEALRLAAPRAGAVEVVLEGADRGPRGGEEIAFVRAIPLAKALHPDTLLADTLNGEPLPRAHGFPLRALVPGWYGMDSVKWLTRLRLVAEPFQGPFQGEDYVLLYPPESGRPTVPLHAMPVQAILGSPGEGERLPLGEVVLRGAAWAGEHAIARVEITVFPSPNQEPGTRNQEPGTRNQEPAPATLLGPEPPRYTWRLWEYRWRPPAPGRYTLAVRAADTAGNTQPDEVPWNVKGYGRNSVQRVTVEVLPEG